jgi:hypothetical protein
MLAFAACAGVLNGEALKGLFDRAKQWEPGASHGATEVTEG